MSSAVDDSLWSAIGDPNRRHILDVLLAAGGGTATTLSEELPITRQAITKHLQVPDRAIAIQPGAVSDNLRQQRLDAHLAVHLPMIVHP